eukprot:TRINITY_DN23051_c0_g1_i1.p1 TRINITY_DN23051_c0_g1~~TRINITY_DN23051_c0_g1_i1.p1  ORF type:complete len:1058 (+),score=256.41 TRINITY_DN23051_c0_g1_i1:128-3301(+)
MATIEAIAVMGSAAVEAASLVWMELTMFMVAGIVYVLFVGTSKKEKPAHKSAKSPSGECHDDDHSAGTDAQQVLADWHEAKAAGAAYFDLGLLVDAMRKSSKGTADIVAEIRGATAEIPGLLSSVEALPAALLRDDNVDVLGAVVQFLEEKDRRPDCGIYAGLMGGLLRRRDFSGVAAVAANLHADAISPRMRSLLAAAAAQRYRLDEALGHVRQMPAAEEGAKSALAPACAAHLLALAAKEQRVPAVTEELVRLNARLEQRHVEELFTGDSRRKGQPALTPASRWDLLHAADALQVAKGPVIRQARAVALAHDADSAGLRMLVQELETLAGDQRNVTEPLALALLDACKACRCGDLVNRVLEMHRSLCAGSAGGKVLSAACGALLACDRAGNACDFYEKEMSARGLWPDAALTSSLMKAAAQVGRSALAQKLSDYAAANRSSTGNSGSSNGDLQRQATMIKAHARERDLKAAQAVFAQVRSSGIVLSPLIYNAMLDAFVQCGDVAAAATHFADMKASGFIDVVSYNTMLKAHLSQGRTDAAQALVKEMTVNGLAANRVTYNELLHAKVMAKDRKGLWSVVDEMRAAGVTANSVTCSILLKALTVQSPFADVKRVTDLIEEVEENIDEVLFSSVIEACIRIRQLGLLSDLMRRYRSKKAFVNLSAPTYGAMIKAYGQAGDVVRVRELWQEMDERGVKPTSITLGCMTESLVANNCPDEALSLLHTQLESAERRGSINTVIYSTVLKGFATAKRMDKVFAVYKEMRDNNIPCNTITYNTLLDACAKSCSMNRASSLLEDMKAGCVEPDIITYSTIIKGYCQEGDVERAFHVLEDMKNDGKFQPDEIMYNSILDGCAKQHRVEQALNVLEEMRKAGIAPSNYTLSILVKALGHARRLGQAFHMVDDLSKQNGFRPNVQVYTCLVQACVLNRRLDKALALHDTMVADSGCRVDDKFYAVLAKGCLQLHQPLKAVEVIRAAFRLPGHTLSERNAPPIGLETRSLDEVCARLQAGSREEQEALKALAADLSELRGVHIGEGSGRRGGAAGGWNNSKPRAVRR